MARRCRCPPEKLAPALGYWGFQSKRQSLHKVLSLRDAQRLPKRLVGGVTPAHAQVLRDGASEQERLLGHAADPFPQLQLGEAAHIRAAQQDLARLDVVEPEQKVGQGAFPGPNAADNGGGLTGLKRERQVAENRLLGGVFPAASRLHTCPGSGGGWERLWGISVG